MALVASLAFADVCQAEDGCADGEVMIGGKCRTLGKKTAPEPSPPAQIDTSGGSGDGSSAQSCAEGQVMIGGKCRTLGKKSPPQPSPPAQFDTSGEGSDGSSAQSCADDQVMIGGKCRTLGKKSPPQPSPPAQFDTPVEGSDGSSAQSCAQGEVMIGGKCRTLGKATPVPPVPSSAENGNDGGNGSVLPQAACDDGQVLIGGKCRTLGKTAAPSPPSSNEDFSDGNDDTALPLEPSCEEGEVLVGGKCRRLGKAASPVAVPPANEDLSQDSNAGADAHRIAGAGDRVGAWGGVVRAGPGRSFRKVTSLREGAPVQIIERIDTVENDFPWFRIDFGGTEIGYMWGGIMCSFGEPLDGLYQTCTTPPPPASQPDTANAASADGLVWQSKWYNDDARGGALTSQLFLGIPETDAVKLAATCTAGEDDGRPSLTLWADVANRKRNARVNVQFISERFGQDYPGVIFRSGSGEGIDGYRLTVLPDDPLWEAMSASQTIAYGETGNATNELPLRGSRREITAFLSGCRLIAEQSGN